MAVRKREYKHHIRKEALSFGPLLRRARRLRGLSVRGLAKMVGISSAYLSQLENGKRNPPPPARLRRLAPYLRVRAERLLEVAGHQPSTHKVVTRKSQKMDSKFQRVLADPLLPEHLHPPAQVTKETKQFIVEMYSALTNQTL